MAYEDYADYADADTEPQTGTTNYNTGSAGQGSAVNASANPITTNSGPVDASGGTGSFPTPLQQTVTQGLNDNTISGAEFAIGSLTDLFRANPFGNTTSAAAPSSPATQAAAAGTPSWLVIAAIVGGVYLLYRMAEK